MSRFFFRLSHRCALEISLGVYNVALIGAIPYRELLMLKGALLFGIQKPTAPFFRRSYCNGVSKEI